MLRRLCPALACAAPLAGCGSTTIVKTVTAPASSTPAASTAQDSAPATTAEAPDRDARLGDTLSLDVSDTTLAIRPLSVLDPLPVGDYDTPDTDGRFVGVRLSIRNTGDADYDDSLDNGATLVLRGDEQAATTIVSGGPCGGSFGSDLKLAAGDRRVGCLAFEVPGGARLRSFQLTGDSGFAEDTGEWRLPSQAPGATPDYETGSDDGSGSGSGSGRSYTSCDANIEAAVGSTSCAFAQNVFYEYFESGESSVISAYSPATGSTYRLDCSSLGASVECEADDGGAVRFSQSAIDSYSEGQASDYAATHDAGP